MKLRSLVDRIRKSTPSYHYEALERSSNILLSLLEVLKDKSITDYNKVSYFEELHTLLTTSLVEEKNQRALIEQLPIGSVLMTATDINPADYLGYGVWARVSQGLYLSGI